ncbi:TonB-dependent receptor plug domain-containing protein [Mucilaginibacter robiniae]|uniref:TonB-dependent receptor plug domain-containing protein n=1 Tax=Mucilaginibacter robiniae TaxID=2728022 RepID=A0A7L5E3F3_9SPHI|nr:carboxypeptidase-like regulatory domain-containing protein [Mucilaginibacter robiniae]QJD97128.1 TonB-dependent receptor plug domain-containing protein [Mucilaginibacter robiniae]
MYLKNILKRVSVTLAALLFLALAGFTLQDDDPVITKITTQLGKWLDTYQPEKVYLQLDKPYYAIGDDIWFKAYVTVGSQHQLSALSGSLNVELINEQDSVKQWIKLPLTSGVCWGDFALPDTLREGNYRIRAYTNWMRNAGPDYYFDKVIKIGNVAANAVLAKTSFTYATVSNGQQITANINYTTLDGTPYAGKEVDYRVLLNDKQVAKGKGTTNPQGTLTINFVNTTPALMNAGRIITSVKVDDKKAISKTIAIKATSGKVDVQFFPESGSLVNGIRSKVAFKAVGPDGLGLDINGSITDNNNQEVVQFTTRHLGMGIFSFTPEAGKTYKAQITYQDGSHNTVDLPLALNRGYVLSINHPDSANISVRVMGSSNLADAGQVYILAQTGGDVRYVAKSKAGSAAFGTTIPTSKFPSGITQFTLFSATGEPLNERIVFIQHPDDLLQLNVNSGKSVTAPREKVQISLNAQNSSGKPVIGSFSASVIDESKVPVEEDAETTILSHLLLTSDLRGYVEQPNYYFNKSNDQTRSDLDVLMLTQGYRRFEWKPVLAGNIVPPAYQPEKLIQISGTIRSGSKPAPGAKITLFTTAGGAFLIDTVADSQGRFAFKNLIVKDSIRFVLQARTAKGKKDVDIILDNNAKPETIVKNRYLSAAEVNNSSRFTTYLQYARKQADEERKYGLGNHTIVLKEVTIREKKQAALQNSSNLNGPGNADQVIMSDVFDKMACPNIADCLQGRLVGVVFRGGVPYSTRSLSGPMQIIVDGVYVDSDYLSIISQYDIASIEVLRSGGNTAIYGSRGGNGVIIINTKRGNDLTYNSSQIYSPGVITYTPKGFYRARQFYSPQYDDPKTNKTVADLRTTIYWNPNLITDKDGHTSLSYFNAGTPGTYRVVIEGMDTDGNLGHQVYRYKVQ